MAQLTSVFIAILSSLAADEVRVLIPESGRSVYVTSDDLVEVSWTRPGRRAPQTSKGSIVNLDPSKTSLADSYLLLMLPDGKREIVQLEAVHSIEVLSGQESNLAQISAGRDNTREVLSRIKPGQILKVVWQHPGLDQQFQSMGAASHLDSLDEVGSLFLNMGGNWSIVDLSLIVTIEVVDEVSSETSSNKSSLSGKTIDSGLFSSNSHFAHLPLHGDLGKQIQPDVLRTLIDRLPQPERYPVVIIDMMLGNSTSKKVVEIEAAVRALQVDRVVVGIVASGMTLSGVSPDAFDLVLYEQIDQSGRRIYKKVKSNSSSRRPFQSWQDSKRPDWLSIQNESLEAALKELGKSGPLKKPGNQSLVSKAMRDAHQSFDDYTRDLPRAVQIWRAVSRRQSEARGHARSARSQSASTQAGYQRKMEYGQKSLNLYSGLIKDIDFIRDTLERCSYYEDSSPLSLTEVKAKGRECQLEATELRNQLKSGG